MQHAAVVDHLIGQTIGNYQVKNKLGEGGMGAVYLAEHPLIGKQVALKVLHAEFSHNPEITERFLNEARAVNDIEHPNIVDILDYGIIPDGRSRTVYFIMEFLGGRSLAGTLRRRSAYAAGTSVAHCAASRRCPRCITSTQHRASRSQTRQRHAHPARPPGRLRQSAGLRHRQTHRRSTRIAQDAHRHCHGHARVHVTRTVRRQAR